MSHFSRRFKVSISLSNNTVHLFIDCCASIRHRAVNASMDSAASTCFVLLFIKDGNNDSNHNAFTPGVENYMMTIFESAIIHSI